jgi:hypothetical protein
LPPETTDEVAQIEVEEYLSSFFQSLPTSEKRLGEIKELQETDRVCSLVKQYTNHGWPPRHDVKGELKLFWQVRDELSVHDELLLRGSRIVIPSKMRGEILRQLHAGHQGINKTGERARQAVWWHRLSTQVEELVSGCPLCVRNRSNPVEPLRPTELPYYPWHKLAVDLFDWKGRSYLIVVDYYSKYIETTPISDSASHGVIQHLKAIFARHGLPEQLFSDNGPQFASERFRQFSNDYCFTHVTSSPRYPQGNGEVERAVATIKNLFEKNEDHYLALLSYRSTPLHHGYSPAELLMNRRLRTTVPMMREQLIPHIPDSALVKVADTRAKLKMKETFDERHRARNLPCLRPVETVWIPDRQEQGRVIAESSPRSYTVSTPTQTVRRNRRHLIPDPIEDSEESTMQAIPPHPPVNSDTSSVSTSGSSAASPMRSLTNQVETPNDEQKTVTRSGRVSRPPERLDL